MVRVAVIPGDGIGNEVIPEAVKVLKAVGEIFRIDLLSNHWLPRQLKRR